MCVCVSRKCSAFVCVFPVIEKQKQNTAMCAIYSTKLNATARHSACLKFKTWQCQSSVENIVYQRAQLSANIVAKGHVRALATAIQSATPLH